MSINKLRILPGLLITLALLMTTNLALAQTTFDWKRFAGHTVNVALHKQPWSDVIAPLVPEFERLTGIKARVEVLPEDQHRQKLTVAFTAGRGDIDVFASQKWNEGLKYYFAKWYEPLDNYVKNSEITSPDLGFTDFVPSAIEDATIRGVLVGLPLYAETLILAYRKDLFREANLSVPDTITELEEAAKKFTDKQKGQYGLCLRGMGAATTGIFGAFLYSMGGSWADEKRNPALTTPAALKTLELYARLTREYGPPGVVNYHWFQCQSLFATGKAAMWIDANSLVPPLLDAAKSQVADKVSYAMFPKGPGGRKPGFGGWHLAIHPSSQSKGPAWYFIQWATNKANTLKAQLKGVPTARFSAWQSEEIRRDARYADLNNATLETLKLKGLPSFGPPWVAIGEIRDIIGAVVVTAIEGGDIKATAENAVQQIQAVRKRTDDLN